MTGLTNSFAEVGWRSEAGSNVFWRERGEIGEDLLLGHAAGEVLENIGYGYPSALDAGLPAPDAWGHRDSVFEAHSLRLSQG